MLSAREDSVEGQGRDPGEVDQRNGVGQRGVGGENIYAAKQMTVYDVA